MKLFHAPRSPFAFKVRIVVHELSLSKQVEFVVVDPWGDEDLRAVNPLCKVPSLIPETGEPLYDSRVICEYLNLIAGGTLFPNGSERWRALRHQTLADGLAEAVIRRYVARRAPSTADSATVVLRQERAIWATVNRLDSELNVASVQAPTIGDIAMVAALTYLSFRSPEIEWQNKHRALAAWFDQFSRKDSVILAHFGSVPSS